MSRCCRRQVAPSPVIMPQRPNNCCCSFPMLVILILIVLQFSRRDCKVCDDEELDYDVCDDEEDGVV